MKPISQDQANYIRKHSPSTHIRIASKRKNSKGKTYFVEETKVVQKLLKEYDAKQE